MKWIFEEQPLNGGAAGDVTGQLTNGIPLSSAERLARESIQNSVDARTEKPNGSVRVDFRFKQLGAAEWEKFKKVSCLKDIVEREESLKLSKLNGLKKTSQPIQLLFIDDYDTTGLSGAPEDPQSHFRRLIFDVAGGQKVYDPGTGGSYGFGKAVYGSSSEIKTIFVFSRTLNATGEPISILIGASYQGSHSHRGVDFTGRGFLCIPVEVRGKGTRFDPFQNEKAEELAKELGFKRDKGLGTSILVIDSKIQPDALIAGIENWWWPRIEANLLDASVITIDDVGLIPRPKLQKHLQPFIAAYDCVRGKSPGIKGQQEAKIFQKLHGYKLGTFGALVLDGGPDENPLGENYEHLLDTVALVRDPLMVVKYHSDWRPSAMAPKVAGCFQADNDIDFILKLSEPWTHDHWSADASRVVKDDDEKSEVVEQVLARIKRNFRDFQNAAKPPASKETTRLIELERALSAWFGVNNPVPPPPPPLEEAPISLWPFGPDLNLENGNLRATGHIEIRLKPDGELTVLPFRVSLTLKVIEEETVTSKDPIPLTLNSEHELVELEDGYWHGVIEKGRPVKIHFQSELYDPNWTVRLVPEVLSVQEDVS